MASPSSLTLNYDSILSTTFFAVRKELYDQIFKDNVVWNVLHSKGRKRSQNGGERIQIPLQYATNSTVGSYSGYDVLDTTPQDNVTSAFYTWKQLSGSVSINRLEERQNSGESQILNLLRQKVTELSMSMQDEASRQLLVPNGSASGSAFTVGNSGKDLLGLPILVADDPTTGTVGNISRSNTWWRNQQTDSSATTYSGYKKELRTMWNDCSKGTGNGPDVALGDQTAYETYEAALDDNTRYTNTVMADMGFDNLRLKGSLFYWDERVPDWENSEHPTVDGGSPTKSSVVYLNTKFLELVVDSQTDFITTPFVRPENQDARTAQVLFMGELTCSNMRKQGVLASILTTIAS
jgi:hypothetical protein